MQDLRPATGFCRPSLTVRRCANGVQRVPRLGKIAEHGGTDATLQIANVGLPALARSIRHAADDGEQVVGGNLGTLVSRLCTADNDGQQARSAPIRSSISSRSAGRVASTSRSLASIGRCNCSRIDAVIRWFKAALPFGCSSAAAAASYSRFVLQRISAAASASLLGKY